MTAEQKLEQLRAHDPGIAVTICKDALIPGAYRAWASRVMDGRLLESRIETTDNSNSLPHLIDEVVHDLMHATLAYESKPITLEELE